MISLELVDIVHVEGIGEAIVYDVTHPDGRLNKGGMISLDKKWMKPTAMGSRAKKWCEVWANDLHVWHYMVALSEGHAVQIHTEIIELVNSVIFEREVLQADSQGE